MIYEILYIIPSRYSDSELPAISERVSELFKKHGAEVKQVQLLEKIKFAYPIKKEQHGTYVLNYIDVEGEAMQKIEKELRLADEVLRHVIVKREDGIPQFTFELSPYQPPITPEGKRRKKRAPKKETPKPAPKKPAKQMSSEELDEKIDKILEGDVEKDV